MEVNSAEKLKAAHYQRRLLDQARQYEEQIFEYALAVQTLKEKLQALETTNQTLSMQLADLEEPCDISEPDPPASG